MINPDNMSAGEHQVLLEQILYAIEHDDVMLPTLPDVAIKIQRLLDDPNVSADKIITILSSDPSIAAQIIKSANSAIFAGRPQIDNVRGAVSRLGYRQMHNLVISITMNRMFCSKNPIINLRMNKVWKHSREVAAVSYVLALRQPYLSPDQAMMAGLIHDIGVLPLCLHIENNHMTVTGDTLEAIIIKCGVRIGAELLKKWNFPQEMVDVVAEHENIHRKSSRAPQADYADVVTIANLQDRARAKMVAWDNIAAVNRLGLSKEECQTFMECNAERIEQVEGMLGISPANKSCAPGVVAPATTIRKSLPAHQPTEVLHTIKRGGLLAFLLRIFK